MKTDIASSSVTISQAVRAALHPDKTEKNSANIHYHNFIITGTQQQQNRK